MAVSSDVPSRLPVGIETHAYQIEPDGFRRETVQVLRQQADVSTEPGEASLNPAGLWRRSQESWHHGAGQPFLDGKDEQAADPHRFRSSKGVDVWTKGQVSLLHPALKVWSTTNTNLFMAVAQGQGLYYAYVADGNEMYSAPLPFSLLNTFALQTGTGWTTVNATKAVAGSSFALTVTGAGAFSATSPTGTSGVPVVPGRDYGFVVASVFSAMGGGSARVPTATISWYTATGTPTGSPTTATAAGNDSSANNYAAGHAVAPANAAFAALTAGFTTSGVAGEIHILQATSIGPYDDVSTAFIGAPDQWYVAGIQAGQAAQPIQSIATNGSYVWAALGTSGLHRNGAGLSASTADVPAAPGGGQISLVGYANGFLLAAGSATSTTGQNKLWLVNSPTGVATLSTINVGSATEHPNPSFVWTGIAPGRNVVYAFGNSGGNGEVYKITYDQNTGTLSTAASFATYLPDGETIHALQFYAGGIIMGTGKGVRLGQADGAGNIDYGPLIPTQWPVRCLEPQDRYCWFGWTKYDASNSGLGRIDLGYMTDTLTPAWASDLMTPETTQGDVVAAVTMAPYGYLANQRPPVRMFSVAGSGVYIEDPGSRVPSGQLLTGTIRFSTSEPKTTRSIDVRHHALPAGGSVAVELAMEGTGGWLGLGTSSAANSFGPATPIDGGSYSVESMELRFTLIRPSPSGTDFSLSPEMTRWTAKVLPTPSTIDETFTIPIIMAREVTDSNDASYPMDVAAEIAYLKGLERTRTLVNLQLGTEQVTVYIAASQFEGKNWSPGRTNLEGLYTIQAQSVRG